MNVYQHGKCVASIDPSDIILGVAFNDLHRHIVVPTLELTAETINDLMVHTVSHKSNRQIVFPGEVHNATRITCHGILAWQRVFLEEVASVPLQFLECLVLEGRRAR